MVKSNTVIEIDGEAFDEEDILNMSLDEQKQFIGFLDNYLEMKLALTWAKSWQLEAYVENLMRRIKGSLI